MAVGSNPTRGANSVTIIAVARSLRSALHAPFTGSSMRIVCAIDRISCWTGPGTPAPYGGFAPRKPLESFTMRSILLWAIGVPIPIILLLAMCTHHL